MGEHRSADHDRGSWRHLVWVSALIVGFWANWWHDRLGTIDFPGHVGLLSTLRDQIAREQMLPLWTSDWYLGASTLLTYLHPLFSLAALSPFAEVFGPIVGLRIGATFFLLLAAASMYAFCRAFGGSSLGAAFGAVIYVLHPSVFVFVGVSGHLHQPVTMAIIPLVFLSWLRLAEQSTPRRILLAAITSALLFYDMQRFWLVFPFALGLYAVTSWSAFADGRSIRGELLTLTGTAAVMAGLLCFPAVPGLLERELLQWHHPESLDLFRERHSFPGLTALVDRDGGLARGLESLTPARFASLPGQWYQGLVALCFIAFGIVLSTRDSIRRAAADAVAGDAIWRLGLALAFWSGALWLAMGVHAIGPQQVEAFGELARAGENGLGAGVLLEHVVLGALAVVWIGLVFFVVRAAALERWPNQRLRVNAATALAVVAFISLTPFVWLARWIFVYGHIRAPGHFGFPLLGFWLGAAAAAVTPIWYRALATRSRRVGILAVVGLVALLVGDVFPYRDRLDRSYAVEAVDAQREGFRSLREQPPGRLLDTRQYNPLANMLGAVEANRPLGWGWLGWSSTRFSSELIADGFYASLRQAAADPAATTRSMETAAGLAALANVRFVTEIGSMSPALPKTAAFASRWETAAVRIHENLRTLPYAQFYPQLAVVSGATREVLPVLARLGQHGVATVTLTEPSQPVPPVDWIDYWFGDRARVLAPRSAQPAERALHLSATRAIADSHKPCTIDERNSRRVNLQCELDQPGYLVIAESWSPNWRVAVDGKPRDLIRMNHAFQGVRLNAGEKRVEYSLHPSGVVRASLWISGGSWIGVVALVLFVRGRSWGDVPGSRARIDHSI